MNDAFLLHHVLLKQLRVTLNGLIVMSKLLWMKCPLDWKE